VGRKRPKDEQPPPSNRGRQDARGGFLIFDDPRSEDVEDDGERQREDEPLLRDDSD